MIISDIIELHRTVQDLLHQQAELFQESTVDFEHAEILSQEVTRLLASLPNAEMLSRIETLARVPLVETARRTAIALAISEAAVARYRQQQITIGAQKELGDLAMRAYLPVTNHQPAHFLDERR